MELAEAALAQEEGVLREHLFHAGTHVDLPIVSFRRDQWAEVQAATGW